MSSKKRVSYFYHGDVGHYYYGPGHPMKVCCDGGGRVEGGVKGSWLL